MADYWESYQEGEVSAASASQPVVRYAFDADEWASFPVAAIFETYRDAYELTLDDVAQALKIRVDYLVAIERGDYEALPGRTFAVGYVRSFANFLQLPADVIVERFKLEAYDAAAPVLGALTIPEPPKEKQLSRGLVVLASLSMLILCWALWLAHNSGFTLADLVPRVVAAEESVVNPSARNELGETRDRVLDLQETTILQPDGRPFSIVSQSQPITQATNDIQEFAFGTPIPRVRPASLQREPDAESVDQPLLPRLLIEASALAWIQVRNSNNEPIVARMLQAGQSHALLAENGLTLTTGSIEALSITIDGQRVQMPPREEDTVVSNLPLDAAFLQGLGAAY